MIASVIRTSGPEGESILCKFVKDHPNEKVRIAVTSVLGYRNIADENFHREKLGIIVDNDLSLNQDNSPFG